MKIGFIHAVKLVFIPNKILSTNVLSRPNENDIESRIRKISALLLFDQIVLTVACFTAAVDGY